jgi:hypothetical protein
MRKPDPDGQNQDRAEWAQSALDAFRNTTGTDAADALKDLLGDLMHWCDENDQDFDVALDAARHYYAEETTDESEAL